MCRQILFLEASALRVLWLKYGEILPADTGGKLRSFHLLHQLSQQVELTFVSYSQAPLTPGYVEQLGALLPGSHVWPVDDIPQWRRAGVRALALSAVYGLPFNVSRFASADARRQLAALVRDGAFDIGICDFLTPSVVYPERVPFASVLFAHNVEWALWQRRTATLPSGFRKRLYDWETRHTRAHEAAMLRRFDATLAVSELDRQGLLDLVPDAAIDVIETGVDVTAFTPRDEGSRDPGLIVFVGSMDWQPNEDGVGWFVAEIWPHVREAVPTARFRIVGRRLPPSITELASQGVEIAADVDSVVPHMHEAAIMVVPLRAGGGTRLKIFEAMAAKAAVVSTTVGAEGLDVADGKDLLLADGARPFADAVIEVLRNSTLRNRLTESASATVQRFDWNAVTTGFRTTLEQIVDRRRRAKDGTRGV